MRLTLKERIFYPLGCNERRVCQHWYTRFLLARVDLERIRRVIARIRRWSGWCSAWQAEDCWLEQLAEQALTDETTTCARRWFHEAAAYFQVGQRLFYLDEDFKRRSLEKIWSLCPGRSPPTRDPGGRFAQGPAVLPRRRARLRQRPGRNPAVHGRLDQASAASRQRPAAAGNGGLPGAPYVGVKGLTSRTPVRTTSETLRVANVNRCTLAVAAMSPSTTGGGDGGTFSCPHTSAISAVTGRIRSW